MIRTFISKISKYPFFHLRKSNSLAVSESFEILKSSNFKEMKIKENFGILHKNTLIISQQEKVEWDEIQQYQSLESRVSERIHK